VDQVKHMVGHSLPDAAHLAQNTTAWKETIKRIDTLCHQALSRAKYCGGGLTMSSRSFRRWETKSAD